MTARDMEAFYSYDRGADIHPRLTLEQENAWYRRYELAYLSEGDTVYAAYFEPKRSGRLPAVVGVHGMFSEAEDQFWFVADFAAKRGLAVVLPSLPYHHRRARGVQVVSGQQFVVARPEVVRDNFRRAVIDIRRAVDWLGSRPNIDPGRVYITGASLGGIVSTLAYKADPRFAGAVFLVTGGSFADILSHSDTLLVRDLRLVSKLGIVDLGRAADVLGMTDPASLPDVWPRPVLMLNATEDVIFPVSDVARLAAALHGPSIVWAKSSHYFPVAGAQYLMVDFLARLARTELEVDLPMADRVAGAPGADALDAPSCREVVLPPVPGDCRLWVELGLEGGGPSGAAPTLRARFGIHLVNRLVPTIILSNAMWDAYRAVLERVPASVFVTEGEAARDLAFALSYLKFIGRGAAGAYLLWPGSEPAGDGAGAPPAVAPRAVAAHLDSLGFEIAWSAATMLTASGLGSAATAELPGLSRQGVTDLEAYFRERVRVSGLRPIPALPDDKALDIRWAQPAF